MLKFREKVLLIYSTVASTAVLAIFLTGAASHRIATFDEIKTHRIDVIEPDGTLRLVISNAAELPGVIVKGTERPPSDRPQAGLLFYNDEGSETGGLIFGDTRTRRVRSSIAAAAFRSTAMARASLCSSRASTTAPTGSLALQSATPRNESGWVALPMARQRSS